MAKHIHRAHRILFVFAPHLYEENRLRADIKHYQYMMRKTSALGLTPPEYFILIVSPHISANVQCTPEIQAYVKRNTEEGYEQLARIGSALGIPPERQCFTEGNRNLKAWHVAKLLGVNKVYGYGKGFVRLLTIAENMQSKWNQTMKKILQLWSLRRKQHAVR